MCHKYQVKLLETLYKACFVLVIETASLLQAVKIHENEKYGILVPDYVKESISTKVRKIIQSHTGIFNRMAWRKGEPMEYADLHIHALCGVDDGAKTELDMWAMVDASYTDGVRTLCVTPHYHPGYFGDNREKTDAVFYALAEYTYQTYPKLKLCLGNELRYSRDCLNWLDSGLCRTLNGTQYVLVDFHEAEVCRNIIRGLEQLLNAGYIPILAHVERYRSLVGEYSLLSDLRANMVIFQMDSQSVMGGFGVRTKNWCKRLLQKEMVDLVSSDAHNLTSRPPGLSGCCERIAKQCGEEYTLTLCRDNAIKILGGFVPERN